MRRADLLEAKAWLVRATSDARTASALLGLPKPMIEADRGCHVSALCAQTVEKSIKGYVVLNGARPATTHRADKYLSTLLSSSALLRHPEHRPVLSSLFDPSTRGAVRELLDLTPGTTGQKHVPNTEYPWGEGAEARSPAGAAEFGSLTDAQRWVGVATRVATTVQKLVIAADRMP